MKSKIILVVLSLLVSYIVTTYFNDMEYGDTTKIMEDYKKRETERDSTIVAYETAMADMKKDIDLLITEKDTYRHQADSSLSVIQTLTRPVVTSKVIDEALLWVKQYNDSLSQSSLQ